MRADEASPTGDQDPHVGLDQTAIQHRQSGSGSGTREPVQSTRRWRSGRRDRALTWKNLEKRSGEGVGGGRVLMCSPLLPLVSFCAIASRTWSAHPDPTKITRQKRNHARELETRAHDHGIPSNGAWGMGRARRSPEQLTQGIGLGLLGSDTGNGRFESD